ncbi:MAG: glycosyltransferase family 4 protein [Chloroflexota bacterium]
MQPVAAVLHEELTAPRRTLSARSPRVALVSKPGGVHTGIGRYTRMLREGLAALGEEAASVVPGSPGYLRPAFRVMRRLGLDGEAFLANYPVRASYPEAELYHFTSQSLATLLITSRPRGKTVVTVHDIIPYMLRNDPRLRPYRTPADRLFERIAMAGLRRADRLIADSAYTKRCLVERLGIDRGRIEVVHLGVDRSRFRPMPVPPGTRDRYGLPEGKRYVIYVGSEDPRKNLAALLRALAEVRHDLPDVELVKVGMARFQAERARLTALAEELGIGAAVRFLDEVPEDDLPLLYNLAELCVMPSLYEGFGFPALESMACGTPVVATDAASLSEVVGDAGLLVQPDTGALARGILRLLADRRERARLAGAGRERAACFTWERTARETLRVYGAAAVGDSPSGK